MLSGLKTSCVKLIPCNRKVLQYEEPLPDGLIQGPCAPPKQAVNCDQMQRGAEAGAVLI